MRENRTYGLTRGRRGANPLLSTLPYKKAGRMKLCNKMPILQPIERKLLLPGVVLIGEVLRPLLHAFQNAPTI